MKGINCHPTVLFLTVHTYKSFILQSVQNWSTKLSPSIQVHMIWLLIPNPSYAINMRGYLTLPMPDKINWIQKVKFVGSQLLYTVLSF